VQTRIEGTVMPVLEVNLDPGESIVAEAGELAWMSAAIELSTTTQAAGSRGVWGALKRVAGGGGLFMTQYTARNQPGSVSFAAKLPGSILPVEMGPGASYMVHRAGFLCATQGVTVSAGFQRSLGAGLFGGDGFVLQKVAGSGQFWVELSGEVMVRDLGVGETLRAHPGHVGMFEEKVRFDITTIPGIRNVIFGGDGLFLASLTGPGRVWLQSMPIPYLAQAIAPYLPAGNEAGAAIGGGIAGAALKGLFSGN
jgi:uncharacterized protein (TIGR00266 family)